MNAVVQSEASERGSPKAESAGAETLSSTRPMPWLLILAALCLLYVPTIYDLFHSLWMTDQNQYGPLVLGVGLWFFAHKLKDIERNQTQVGTPAYLAGCAALCAGLLLYLVGRSQTVYLLEVGSLVPVLLGISLLVFGSTVSKRMWFALFFLCFAIPFPGAVVDTLTQPLKLAVSWGTDNLLYALGYPVARTGVTLMIGQYQLMVADACAGLNSLFALEVLGLLYVNLVRSESAYRNLLLAACIVPISFTSNLLRVTALCLITYYFGDAAGQGFAHKFSGMVMFLIALLLIIGLDGVLRRLFAAQFRPYRPASGAILA